LNIIPRGETMDKAETEKLINLDECVLNALKLLADSKTDLPEVDFDSFGKPLVVGSGNAAATGRIIFADKDAVFANESTYETKLKNIPIIDSVALFSASTSKHAPEIASTAKEKNKKVVLLTCNPDATTMKNIDKVYVFPYAPEPYTYNTSTYMGMILAKTKENAQQILDYIRKDVDQVLNEFSPGFDKFDAFFLLVPKEFDLIRIMLQTKFVELFGRRVARDVFTWEQAMHATTLVPYDSELFISFGYENKWWGKHKLHIPLPENAGYAAMMAIGYYVIGKIQVQKPAWFKENVAHYCKEAKKWFGKEMPLIVRYD
jgi:D-arabinose 5-phosphate isomerase GutQ